MTAWVALLRAVNLGARNKVPMALRALLERAGHGDVRTYIQSGKMGPPRAQAARRHRAARVHSPDVLAASLPCPTWRARLASASH